MQVQNISEAQFIEQIYSTTTNLSFVAGEGGEHDGEKDERGFYGLKGATVCQDVHHICYHNLHQKSRKYQHTTHRESEAH